MQCNEVVDLPACQTLLDLARERYAHLLMQALHVERATFKLPVPALCSGKCCCAVTKACSNSLTSF